MISATFRRARVRQSELSKQRVYRSTDGRWKLIEVCSLVGLGRYWLLVRVNDNGGEYVAAKHRTRLAAERTFNRLNRENKR